MSDETRKLVKTTWDLVEEEFPDKSTEFLIEMTAQRVRLCYGRIIDNADVCEAISP